MALKRLRDGGRRYNNRPQNGRTLALPGAIIVSHSSDHTPL
jgi:hypothetical protein